MRASNENQIARLSGLFEMAIIVVVSSIFYTAIKGNIA
jgi:hypothetical protein